LLAEEPGSLADFMRVCVCLRQVPDPRARLELRTDGLGLREDGVAWVTDEGDECALEEGLRLVKQTGGEVCALTAGPDRAAETLRRALALGAQRALHLRGEVPVDPARVAALLAGVLRREPWDLVLAGAQSSDFGWGLTGSSLAAELGWPHVWLVVGIETEDSSKDPRLHIARELEGRRRELSRVRLPAVLCVQTGLHPPRMPRIRDLLAAKSTPIETLDLDELLRESSGERARPAVELVTLSAPPASNGGEQLVGDPATAARELVRRLRRDGILPETT
jgi:electron transfer flavoprotein beta subunit